MRNRSTVRRGVSGIQVALVLAAVGVTVVVAIGSLGEHAKSDLSLTAENVADPASLVGRFEGGQYCGGDCDEPGGNDGGDDGGCDGND